MENSINLPDQQLIRLYRDGSIAAFKILYERHQKSVYSSIYKMIKNQPLTDDIFQDVFLRVIESLKDGRYNEEGKFIHWILRVAHNLCVDAIRKHNKCRLTLNINDESFEESLISSFPDGESLLIAAQSKNSLFRMIKLLPHEQQEVLILRHYAGLSFKSIAGLTKCCTNTALGRMRYCMLNLRKLADQNSNAL